MGRPEDLLKEPEPAPVETEEVKQLKADLLASQGEGKAAKEEAAADRAKVVELEETAKRTPPRPAAPGVPKTAAEIQAETYEEIREGIYTAPGHTLDQHFNRRMGPVLQDYYNTQAGVAKELGLAKVSEEDKKKYGAEAEKLMEAVDPVTKANPNAWGQAFNLVKAQHLPEIIESEKEAVRKELEVKPPGHEGPTPTPEPVAATAELTPEEKLVCQRYIDDGVLKDEEEYKKWKR
jgi:hypothetical protein